MNQSWVDQAFIINRDGKQSRTSVLDWPAPPEDIGTTRLVGHMYDSSVVWQCTVAFIRPYVFSVLPSGSVPIGDSKENLGNTTNSISFIQSTVVQIRSSLTLLPVQTLPFPFASRPPSSADVSNPSSATPANAVIRLLTPSPIDKSPLFLVTTPTDRTAAATDGSSIWQFRMKSWAAQIDELVQKGLYSDALLLLDIIDPVLLADKVKLITRGCSCWLLRPTNRSNEKLIFGPSMLWQNFVQANLMMLLIPLSILISIRRKW